MMSKNNLVLAGLAGISAAAVAVLSVGGYILHKKVMKHRLQEQARRQAMNLAFFDLTSGKVTHDGFEDFENECSGADCICADCPNHGCLKRTFPDFPILPQNGEETD